MNHRDYSQLTTFLVAVFICLILFQTSPLIAAEVSLPQQPLQPVQVEAQIAPVSVRINDKEIDRARALYPLLLYKDITYIPLTYNLCQALGLESSWERAYGLRINPSIYVPLAPLKQDFLPANEPDQLLGTAVTAQTATIAVYLADNEIDNSIQDWPLLIYNDITYLPLTWQFVHDMLHISYNFVGGSNPTLYLQRPIPNVKIDAERMNQIVATAAIKLKTEALSATTTVTKSGYETQTTVDRFDPAQKLIWQSVYLGNNASGQHLLTITYQPQSSSGSAYQAPLSAPQTTYQPQSSSDSAYQAPLSAPITKTFFSADGVAWHTVNNAAYATYLPSQPALPVFDLVPPVEGWQITNEDGAWFIELDNLTLSQDSDGSGKTEISTYRFDLSNWFLTQISSVELPLQEGRPLSNKNQKFTLTTIEYGSIEDVPDLR